MPPKRSETTEAMRAAVLTWHKAGKSIREIVTQEKIARSTVYDIIRRARERPDDPLANKPRSGRPEKVLKTGQRKLVRHATWYTQDNLAALATPGKSGAKLFKPTVHKILSRFGVHRRKARRKPYLKKEHRKEQVRWCRAFQHFTKEDWRNVIWSDEATFEVGKDTRTIWVSCRLGQEWDLRNLQPSFKSGRTTVGVWGAIMGGKVGPLHMLEEGRMNMTRYTNEVLEPLFFSFYQQVKAERERKIWTMKDNAKWHTGRIPTWWRAKHQFERIWWPAQSPDLNPIENVWRILKLRISRLRHHIHNTEQMRNLLQQEWAKLRPKDFDACINSMTTRIALCLKAKGGPIKY